MSAGCGSCYGQCCYNALVRVTGDDIRRIARAQQLKFSSFVRVVPDRGQAGDKYPVAFAIGSPPAPHLLALRHSARVNGACTFLLLLRNRQPCGVYADRPMVCRVYPMYPTNGGVAVRENIICRPEYWDASTIDETAWGSLVAQRDDEWRIYAEVVRVWNSSMPASAPGDPSPFLGFLQLAYDRIDDWRAATFLGADLTAAIIAASARDALVALA